MNEYKSVIFSFSAVELQYKVTKKENHLKIVLKWCTWVNILSYFLNKYKKSYIKRMNSSWSFWDSNVKSTGCKKESDCM